MRFNYNGHTPFSKPIQLCSNERKIIQKFFKRILWWVKEFGLEMNDKMDQINTFWSIHAGIFCPVYNYKDGNVSRWV